MNDELAQFLWDIIANLWAASPAFIALALIALYLSEIDKMTSGR